MLTHVKNASYFCLYCLCYYPCDIHAADSSQYSTGDSDDSDVSSSLSGVLLALLWQLGEAVQVGVSTSGLHVGHRSQQERHDVRNS